MEDLIVEFLEEANESMTKLDQDFVDLEQSPDDAEIVKNIFRVMHTIKGTAGFLAFSRLEKVAHAAETLMDKVRNNEIPVNSDLISLVLKASDEIKDIISGIEQTQAEMDGDSSAVIEELKRYCETGGAGEVANAQPVASSNSNKTPDLDEEIDFTPITADYAEDNANISGADIAAALKGEINLGGAPKTPDLDEEIDFEPIAADYVDVGANISGADIAAALKGEIKVGLPESGPSEQEKKKAAEIGLKIIEKDVDKVANNNAGPAAQQGIRVGVDVLENLMQLVGELVLTRNQLVQISKTKKETADGLFGTSLQRLNLITSELQEGVMKTRMQPIKTAWAKFPRMIRDLAKELGKEVDLIMEGEETEIDRQMLEAIKDPLMHMVRNAADHGLEKPDARKVAGKPEKGVVTLSAYHEGGHIIIKITDDGKGLNPEVIKKKAIEKGLATEQEVAEMTEKQVFSFIFKPGFSTAEKVTSVSGRGVGMDVVVTNIERMGGSVELESRLGQGSEFSVKLPLTLAIMPVLIIKTAEETFAIPQIGVSEIVKVEKDKAKNERLRKDEKKLHKIEVIKGNPVLRLRGKILPLISLSEILGLSRSADVNPIEAENYIIVCELGSSTFGLLVDKVYHTEEIVVKQKSSLVSDLDVYSGSTILGDGSVILIIDLNGLLKTSGVTNLSPGSKKAIVQKVFDEDEISFLVFETRAEAPMAIPLELVSRLEELDYSKMENSAGKKLLQYRGDLMQLITIDGHDVPEDGIHDTIVFSDRGKVLGIYVSRILDIVRDKLEIKSSSKREGILGSQVMNGMATDLVDISHFISLEFANWLGHEEANKIETIGENIVDRRSHVLLVDDSAFFRKFMRPVILAAGYRVTTCENGQEGLDTVMKYPKEFDLVISDIDMPVMNGIEFVTQAKKEPSMANIPFIALTSHKEEDFDIDIKEIGFEALVTKTDRNKVISLISDILKERKVA